MCGCDWLIPAHVSLQLRQLRQRQSRAWCWCLCLGVALVLSGALVGGAYLYHRYFLDVSTGNRKHSTVAAGSVNHFLCVCCCRRSRCSSVESTTGRS